MVVPVPLRVLRRQDFPKGFRSSKPSPKSGELRDRKSQTGRLFILIYKWLVNGMSTLLQI